MRRWEEGGEEENSSGKLAPGAWGSFLRCFILRGGISFNLQWIARDIEVGPVQSVKMEVLEARSGQGGARMRWKRWQDGQFGAAWPHSPHAVHLPLSVLCFLFSVRPRLPFPAGVTSLCFFC